MAQTTGAVANACAKVWISTDAVVWTDISGVSNAISGVDQTRIKGEAYTFDGTKAIVKSGKREPMEVEVKIVYSETDAEAYEQVRLLFESAACAPNFYLRYSPRGGEADDEQLTSDVSVLSSFSYPPVDATEGGPIMTGFKVYTPGFTTTIIAS